MRDTQGETVFAGPLSRLAHISPSRRCGGNAFSCLVGPEDNVGHIPHGPVTVRGMSGAVIFVPEISVSLVLIRGAHKGGHRLKKPLRMERLFSFMRATPNGTALCQGEVKRNQK